MNENTVQDSAKITNDSTRVEIGSPHTTPSIQPIEASAETGKVIFLQNEKAMIAYDQRSQSGIIKIDGTEYPLSQLTFSENNYFILGNNIKIIAENGTFQDQTTDCLYGNFPMIKIITNNKEINLPNIKVQDCPAY